jgi:lambda family phage portal protein
MDLAKLTLRSIAAGLGVPEYLLTGDLSQANYSSLRAGLTEFRRRAEQVTHHVLIPTFLRPVWRRWMTLEILAGRIVAPGFEADPESWLSVLFYPPPIPILDPLKDTEADAEAIAAGLKSRRQALAERGLNIEVVDAEIAADKAREKGLGINFDTAVAAAVKVPTVAR